MSFKMTVKSYTTFHIPCLVLEVAIFNYFKGFFSKLLVYLNNMKKLILLSILYMNSQFPLRIVSV